MGFLKEIFFGKQISKEEKMRRIGSVGDDIKGFGLLKPYDQMNALEISNLRKSIAEIPELNRRIDALSAFAEAGDKRSIPKVWDLYYYEKFLKQNDLDLEKLFYWGKKTLDNGFIDGYYYLGLTDLICGDDYGNPEKGFLEVYHSLALGNIAAINTLKNYWYIYNESTNPDEIDNMQYIRALISSAYDNHPEALEKEWSKDIVDGLFYYYGIHFEKSIDKAMKCFRKINMSDLPAGLEYFISQLLILDDDDEDEDDE